MSEQEYKFEIGDTVRMKLRYPDEHYPQQYGTVIDRYAQKMTDGKTYDELYKVQWVDGKCGIHYLPCALEKAKSN